VRFLRSACPNCGHENELGAKFCSECGIALAERAPASLAFEPTSARDRRIVRDRREPGVSYEWRLRKVAVIFTADFGRRMQAWMPLHAPLQPAKR
jgi:hypothetical protein